MENYELQSNETLAPPPVNNPTDVTATEVTVQKSYIKILGKRKSGAMPVTDTNVADAEAELHKVSTLKIILI
jgi:hypothetical protein